MKIRILLILLILISACKQNKKDTQAVIITDKSKSELNNKTEIIIPENIDSEFKLFLNFFNKDSTFQISRVDFPIKIKDFQKVEFELNERIVNQSEYVLKKISVNKTSEKEDFREYEQTIIIENENALIEINGIENGIAIEYEFKKINGKWKLITWTDQST
ncbi:hypothetical protein ACFSSB_03265 [Lacinutrix gracilariae]|uniref:DUF4348 domain-containing protein n=1 Tax=Lacinutrix gracilariae TaxID=1747198 RepID=A0ABW5JZU0_9FLAO